MWLLPALSLVLAWVVSNGAQTLRAANVELGPETVIRLRQITSPYPPAARPPESPDGRSRLAKRRPKGFEFQDGPQFWADRYKKKRSNSQGDVPNSRLTLAKAVAEKMPGGRLGKQPERTLVRPVPELARETGRSRRIVTLSELNAGKTQQRGAAAGVAGWTNIGPGNIGGRTRAIVPITRDIVYAGGVAGGVWKTFNGGQSWVVLDDSMANLAVSALAATPQNLNVLYAGTGEGYFNGDAVQGDGIFKTSDAGATWTQLTATASNADFRFVNKIAVSQLDASRVYAATSTGLFRSTNAGSTWTRLASSQLTGRIFDLIVGNNAGQDVIFCYKRDSGFFASTDGGSTFTARNTGLTISYRASIAASRTGDRLLAVCGNTFGDLDGIFTSTDQGGTWTRVADPAGSGFDGDFAGQLWYDNVCAIDPTNSNRFWVGGINLFVSSDAGQSWTQASRWCALPDDPDNVHADQHAIVFSPTYDGSTDQRIFFGCDGGVYITDTGAASPPTFYAAINGYGVTQFYQGAISASGDVIVGGTQDNGTNVFDTNLGDGTWNRVFPGDGTYSAVDQTNPSILYVQAQFGALYKTTVGAGCTTLNCFIPSCYVESVNGIGEGLPFIAVLAMDPDDSNRLWIGGTQPWRTTNGAANWSSGTAGVQLAGTSEISAIAIAPGSLGQVVWIGYDSGQVFRTTNGLAGSPTWLARTSGLPAGRYVAWIAPHPTDVNTAYIVFSNFDVPGGQVWKTTDGGATFTAARGSGAGALPNVPCHSALVNPNNPQHVYVGTDIGVFASEDGGLSWTNINSPGLANTVVESLSFQSSTNRLFAFTHGRGAYVAEVLSSPTPRLSLDAIQVATSTVGTGQTFPVTVSVSNTGTATLTVTRENLVVSSGILTTPQLSITRVLTPGATASFVFTVTAGSQGTASITSATFTATSSVDGQPVGVFTNRASPVAITVVTPAPALRIVSITPSATTVGVQQSFTATVTLSNNGTGAARVSAGRLVVSGTQLSPLAASVGPVTLSAGGGQAAIVLPLTGGPSLGQGRITSATFTAISLFDSSAAQVTANVAAAALVNVIDARPNVRLTSFAASKTRVNVGQSFSASLNLRNDGTAAVNITSARLVFSGSAISVQTLSSPRTLAAGGGTLKLDFAVNATAAGSSTLTSAVLTMTNAATGAVAGISANQASALSIAVNTPPKLEVLSVGLPRPIVSRGDTGLPVQVRLANTAPASTGGPVGSLASELRIGALSSGYSIRLLSPVPSTLAAGASTIVTYLVDVLGSAALGAIQLAADVRAIDPNTGSAPALVNTTRPSWTVKDGAAMRVTTVTLERSQVVHGDTGVRVQVGLQNTASPATGSAAVELGATLLFGGTASGYSVTSSAGNTAALAAGSSTIATFFVDVLPSAARGPVTVAPVVSAKDEIGGRPLAVSYGPSGRWTVLSRGSVGGVAFEIPRRIASRGQTGVPVQLTTRNDGDLPIVLAAGLRFNGSSAGFAVTTSAGNVTRLSGGQSAVLSFAVDVLSAAPLGSVTVTADIQALDEASGLPVAAPAAGSAAWTVQEPAALRITALQVSRPRAVKGQLGLQAEVLLQNTRAAATGAAAEEVAASLLFGGSTSGFNSTPLPGNAKTVPAGETRLLTYVVDVLANAPGGPATVTALASAVDGNARTAVPVTSGASAPLEVLTPGSLVVYDTASQRRLLTRGEKGIRVEALVFNTGETAVLRPRPRLLFNGSSDTYLVQPGAEAGADIGAGQTRALTFTVDTLPGSPLGDTDVRVRIDAIEQESGAPATVSVLTSFLWSLLTPADVQIVSVRPGRAQAVRGERAVPIEVTVSNGGQTDVIGLEAELAFAGGSSGFRSVAVDGPRPLSGGATEVLTFLVDALAEAPVGDVAVTAKAAGFENTGLRRVQSRALAGSSGTLRVLASAALEVISVAPGRSTVSRGQAGVPVRVSVRNKGQTPARLSARLLFNGGDGGYRVTASPANAARIEAGSSAVLDFAADVLPDAALGAVSIGAQVEATDAASGLPASVASLATGQWTVQRGAALVVRSVLARRPAMAVGDSTGLTVTLQNSGEAGARLVSVALPLAQDSAFRSMPVTPAIELAAGASAPVELEVRAVSSGAQFVTSALVEALDATGGQRVPIVDNLSGQGALLSAGLRPIAALSGTTSAISVDGAPVALALDAGASSDPDGELLTFEWEQILGPAVALEPGSVVTQRVTASAPGRYGFRVTAADPLGLTSQAAFTALVLANRTPAVTIAPRAPFFAGESVELSALATDADGDPLSFVWTRQSGPATLAVEPLGPRVRLRASEPGAYALAVTVSDGRGGISSAVSSVEARPALTAQIRLGAGPNLISLPIAPFTTDGRPYDSSAFLRDTGVSSIARLLPGPAGTTRFVVHVRGSAPFALEPGEGYLVASTREATLNLTGRPWPEGTSEQIVRPWLTALGYPRGVPAGETAATLAARLSAKYVVRTVIGVDGASRFETYLPGASPAFGIEPGAAYLFQVPVKRYITLPAR